MNIYPILMAGGVGSRLWPSSRASYPKQFLRLYSDKSMLQESVARISDDFFEAPIIICHEDHRFLVGEHCKEIGLENKSIILEQEGKGTAFTIAIGALQALYHKTGITLQEKRKDMRECLESGDQEFDDVLLLVLSCDHKIDDQAGFMASVQEAVKASSQSGIVVFGVKPDSAHTGYGYIELENHSENKEKQSDISNPSTLAALEGVFNVSRFKEKPDEVTAQEYLSSGNYLWNSGVFLFKATDILQQLKEHVPDVFKQACVSFESGYEDLDFLRLGSAQCQNISIDYAVLEKADCIKAVALQSPWSDLGSWHSIWQQCEQNKQGNVSKGDVLALDTQNSLLLAHDKYQITALGLENIAVISEDDAVLVMPLDKAQNVSEVVEHIKKSSSKKKRSRFKIEKEHRQVFRPWGNYKVLDWGDGYLIKSLEIYPGGSVSLQYHNHRAEHWVVVKGEIKVIKDDEEHILGVNQSIYIPIKATHRIINPSASKPAQLIEVQTGDILEEEDIVRLEDKYKRV